MAKTFHLFGNLNQPATTKEMELVIITAPYQKTRFKTGILSKYQEADDSYLKL